MIVIVFPAATRLDTRPDNIFQILFEYLKKMTPFRKPALDYEFLNL